LLLVILSANLAFSVIVVLIPHCLVSRLESKTPAKFTDLKYADMTRLFSPVEIGQCHLKHRLVMAPLTRLRADDAHVQLPFVKEYYAQRASVPGILLISEATFISPRGLGYPNVPGIYNDAQIQAWKEITDAVHVKGS